MVEGPIIDSIWWLRVEDFAGHIERAEIGTQRRAKNRTAVDVCSKRYRKDRQVNGQHQQANELNVGAVQAAFDCVANPNCDLVNNVCDLLISAYSGF